MNMAIDTKKKWYKTKWGILVIVLFAPIVLMVYLTRLIWRQKWNKVVRLAAIVALWGFVLIMGGNTPTKNPQGTAANSFQEGFKAAAAPTNTSKTKQTPEQTFESICAKYGGANNCIYEKDKNGAWSITQLIETKEEFMLFSTSKQISRDFIFAVYATKLPIAHASITITIPGKYYRAGLGADVAKTQSESTWTSNDVGPSIFYDFLKASTNGSAGGGDNSTYVETNLD